MYFLNFFVIIFGVFHELEAKSVTIIVLFVVVLIIQVVLAVLGFKATKSDPKMIVSTEEEA
jgi:hypothetical protein